MRSGGVRIRRSPCTLSPSHSTRSPRTIPTGAFSCADNVIANVSAKPRSGNSHMDGSLIIDPNGMPDVTMGHSAICTKELGVLPLKHLSIDRAVCWFVQSGIQEPGGGVARY